MDLKTEPTWSIYLIGRAFFLYQNRAQNQLCHHHILTSGVFILQNIKLAKFLPLAGNHPGETSWVNQKSNSAEFQGISQAFCSHNPMARDTEHIFFSSLLHHPMGSSRQWIYGCTVRKGSVIFLIIISHFILPLAFIDRLRGLTAFCGQYHFQLKREKGCSF